MDMVGTAGERGAGGVGELYGESNMKLALPHIK